MRVRQSKTHTKIDLRGMKMDLRVLSIQSHVVFGYVGNKCATFPLQVLGLEVDAINSVQLSNHTGYKTFDGQVLKDTDLENLMRGLFCNGLDDSYTHVVTGYVGSETFMREVFKTVQKLKEKNPNLCYVCDPVIGDEGKAYVPESLIPIFADSLIPLADILTPNQTELHFLTGERGDTLESVLRGIELLHDKGCKVVVVTTADFGNNNELTVIVSDGRNGKRAAIDIPKLNHRFTGSGDLFAALFLAWYAKLNNDVCGALERTVSTVYKVLERTVTEAKGNSGDNSSVRSLELKLIQSKSDIENPQILFKCRSL